MGDKRQFHAKQSSLPRHLIDQLGVRQFILAEWGSKSLHRTCECPERNGAARAQRAFRTLTQPRKYGADPLDPAGQMRGQVPPYAQ